jgi:DNA polymerase-1
MKETFLIVDGNSLIHRAFHALPLLNTSTGVYTNAVQGFFGMLFKVFQEEKPRYCAVAFDEHGPTFRHTVYAAYKAGRAETPPELRSQFPLIRELLNALGIGTYSLAGYEADDLLGTFAKKADAQGLRALLLTGDRDALQLVDNNVSLLFPKKGFSETMLFTPVTVKEEYGITPEQVTDWKGLMGDSSDNIPGVPGVGEKTAVKLLAQFGTLENVLENAGGIPGKLGEKIRDNAELARFSKDLATIRPDAPLELRLPDCRLNRLQEAQPLFQKYELNSLSRRLALFSGEGESAPEAPVLKDSSFGPWEELSGLESIHKAAEELAKGPGPVAIHLGDSLTLASLDGHRFRVTLMGDLLSPGLSPGDALLALSPLFEKQEIIVHDLKGLLHKLQDISAPLPDKVAWDTMIGAYLINPQEHSYGLHNFTPQGEEDASQLLPLYKDQKARLTQNDALALMVDMEMPLSRVLFSMERAGFVVDREVLNRLGVDYTQQIETLREQVYTLTGVRGFNLNSPQQLSHVLFETLGLPAGKKSQKGYSTSADILEGLTELHPAITPLLNYRQIVKLNGTYIEGLLRLMGADSRVHTTFDQVGTATGRISSNDPNLQNIPVRSELGREIRRAFIPQPGWVLLDADYSQIELRVLAHLSGDKNMVEAFQLGQDIHTRTASEVFGVDMKEVTPKMRSSAKAVNFGLVYGISDFGLARNTGVTRKEAAEFMRRYFERYPGVKTFMEDAVKSGKEKGYAQTLFNRRRNLPELNSSNSNTRNFGERVAMNAPVQGTAADIIKLAMVRVYDALKREKLKARLTLQVHDELLIECPPEEAITASTLLKDCMEQVVKLKVPLIAEVNQGPSWYDTK